MEWLADRLASWASILENDVIEQAARAARMPFVYPHAVLMPDAHLGKGCCIGLGLPTMRTLIPSCIGVDIGCGMMAVRLGITRADFRSSQTPQELHDMIASAIPLSAGVYNDAIYRNSTLDRIAELEDMDGIDSAQKIAPNWRLQLGSLGSGNHFIEVCVDEDGHIWLFLHSGSRGVGNKLATHHIKVAQALCQKWWIPLEDPDLAYLVEGTPEFSNYYRDLRWAQKFAFLNREEMMLRVLDVVARWLGTYPEITETVNCHHNYTEKEHLWGKDVWMSRKGAIDASAGRMGLIPGSMGAESYVVRGKGNRLALDTAPHGAGRAYSRSQARKLFGLAELSEAMGDRVWGNSADFADEHPDAYKPVGQVVKVDSADLVEVVHTLRQIVNVKGLDIRHGGARR